MIGEKKERWLELCEQASVEQDPKKLLELVSEINQLLREKAGRLRLRAKPETLKKLDFHG
jgi:hypothetical protein